jgi:hypothetical protein
MVLSYSNQSEYSKIKTKEKKNKKTTSVTSVKPATGIWLSFGSTTDTIVGCQLPAGTGFHKYFYAAPDTQINSNAA